MALNRKLWHSAQRLSGPEPDIIYKGEKPIKDERERKEIISVIDAIVLHPEAKLSKPKGVTVYYKNESFVIKSIPIERDSHGRISPILSQGIFPNEETTGDWIQAAFQEIQKFASSIERTFSEDIILEIQEGLREANEDKVRLQQKKYFNKFIIHLLIICVLLVLVVVMPFLLGSVLHIPQLFQEVINQKLPQDSTQILDQKPIVLQILDQKPIVLKPIVLKFLVRMAILISVNNALLILILLLILQNIQKIALPLRQKHRRTVR